MKIEVIIGLASIFLFYIINSEKVNIKVKKFLNYILLSYNKFLSVNCLNIKEPTYLVRFYEDCRYLAKKTNKKIEDCRILVLDYDFEDYPHLKEIKKSYEKQKLIKSTFYDTPIHIISSYNNYNDDYYKFTIEGIKIAEKLCNIYKIKPVDKNDIK